MSIFSQDDVEGKISGYFDKYCSESQKSDKLRIFSAIFRKLPQQAHDEGIKAIELVLPQACLLNFPAWLIDRTLNLAIYGIHEKKLKGSTIEFLTEMIPSVSIGKIDYNEYGLLMENMLDAGIPKELVFDLYRTALESNYSRIGVEALAYYYVSELKLKNNHKTALSEAIKLAKNPQKFGDRYAMFEYMFNEDPEKKIKNRKISEDEIRELDKKWKVYWNSYKNKIHYSEKYEKKKIELSKEEITAKLKSREGVSYGYRIDRSTAVDISGLISFLTGEKIDNLPYVYESYCSGGPVILSSGQLNPGDLIFLKSARQTNDSQVSGLYLDSGEFLLITHSRGVEILNLKDDFFRKKFIKACRFIK